MAVHKRSTRRVTAGAVAILRAALLSTRGAQRARMPGFVEPCLANSDQTVPAGDAWCREIKFDGYRVQAHLYRGRCRLFTRKGHDWTGQFQSVAAQLGALDVESAVLDGELIVADSEGRSDFNLLKADLSAKRSDRMIYCAFDALYANGFDLRQAILSDRRRVLEMIMGTGHPRILLSRIFEGDSSELLERACEMNLEGIVSKKWDSRYRSGRSNAWRKAKCRHSDTFAVVAFVEKLGAKPRRVASLYLGRMEAGRLLYAGKVQNGFTLQDQQELRERLDPYITRTSPLSEPVKKPKATWVAPKLQVEVKFNSVTENGRLRAPVYKGIRDDL